MSRKPKLERQDLAQLPHELNVWQGDQFQLWPSPFDNHGRNLTIVNDEGQDVFRLFGLSLRQMRSLRDGLTEAIREIEETSQQPPDWSF